MQLNIKKKKQKNPTTIKKCAEALNRQFSKEDIKMAKKHLERCPTSLIIRGMQIKTTTRYHLTPVRMASSRSLQIINAGVGVENGEKRTLLHCWWECKLVQLLQRTVWRFLKKLKIELTYDPAIPHPGHISRENHNSKSYMHPNVHCSTVYNSQDMETT